MMAHGQTFDFTSFLCLQTRVDAWDVQELSGGAANHTVRITRLADFRLNAHDGEYDDEESLAGHYRRVLTDHSSVVFKQAPAFLAKSPHIPFSPYRQTIEAAALQLLHQSIDQHSFGLRDVLTKNPLIHIPRLLLQDTTHDILVQSDLGVHSNLHDVLTNPETSVHIASSLGKTIGHFLANLHDAFYISSETLIESPDLVAAFENEDAERVMESVIRQAVTFMKEAGVSDYQALGKLALDHWTMRHKTAFSQGDIWFGTLLVLDLERQSSDIEPTIGICDWEFAGPNHPAADIAQLGSYLHLMSLSPSKTSQVGDVLLAFSTALYGEYFSTTSVPYKSLEYRRSLSIMHGWELINAAGWHSRQHMWCGCAGTGVRCLHIKGMVLEGAALLRAVVLEDSMDLQALKMIPWTRFFRIFDSR